MSAREFIDSARALKGARWRHRGRKPWAVDCIGLVVLAGRKAGLVDCDVSGYGREPWNDLLREGCHERFGEPLPPSDAMPGDIAVIRWGDAEPSHVAIIGDHPDGGLTLIHASNMHGVVEHSLAGEYLDVIVEVYRPWGRE